MRTATNNQLLGQVDRAFPDAGSCVAASLLATKVGRLVIGEFTALAHRANRIAYAMVRDQTPYHPEHWS